MTKWAYRKVYNCDEDDMNQLGAVGWELVGANTIIDKAEEYGNRDGNKEYDVTCRVFYTFKRPIEETAQ